MRRYLPLLDWLRFVASMAVVALHAEAGMESYGRFSDRFEAHYLNAGVDLFFVVSGFVVVWTTSDGDSARSFIWRRFVRIAPLYYFATIVAYLAFGRGREPISAGQFLGALAFVPWRVDGLRFTSVYGPAWTLSFEMIFYASFAFGMLTRRRVPATTGLLLAMVFVRPLLFASSAPFWSDPLLFEFAAGMVLAVVAPRVVEVVGRRIRYIAPTVVFAGAAALIFFNDSREELGIYRAAAWGVPAILIVSAIVFADLHRDAVQVSELGRRLGQISFPIYLVHVFVIRVVATLMGRLDSGRTLLAELAAWVIIVIGTVIAGDLADRFVDIPIRRQLNALPGRFRT